MSYCQLIRRALTALLFCVELFVGWKGAVNLEGRMQVFWACIRFGVASHLGVANVLRIEEVAEVSHLTAGNQFFCEAGHLVKIEYAN